MLPHPQVAQTLKEFAGLWIYKRMYDNKQNTSLIPFFDKNRNKNDLPNVFFFFWAKTAWIYPTSIIIIHLSVF